MKPLVPETIETERLKLRQLTIDDRDAVARTIGDPEVMKFLGGKPQTQVWEIWRSLSATLGHWALRGYGSYAVEVKATGKLAGRIGLLNPVGWPDLELAWTLDRGHWGKGYATEAARAAGRAAVTHLKVDRLISLIHPDNLASQRVAERLGATREGKTDFFGADNPAYVYRHDLARFR
jgi:RimJ/RimL family protein N-acetyltransferase